MEISIIICTRNRPNHLQKTLGSIAQTRVPSRWDVELLVVDNGPTGRTREVVRAAAPAGWAVRYIVEKRPGLSRARNRGIAESKGDVILFTDDDVRVPRNWIEPMVSPILDGDAHAVAGGIRLAESRRRDWMTVRHTMLLADTQILEMSGGKRMVGANMAIARAIFDVVGAFDPELGPGPNSTGFHEETLFSFHLQRAGFRLCMALDVTVKHVPSKERLRYRAFVDSMKQQGRSEAYLDYHWRHMNGTRARSLAALVVWLVVSSGFRLLSRWRQGADGGEIELSELEVRRRVAYHREMLRLIGAPRRYEKLSHEVMKERKVSKK